MIANLNKELEKLKEKKETTNHNDSVDIFDEEKLVEMKDKGFERAGPQFESAIKMQK